jgi:hypothetical protein
VWTVLEKIISTTNYHTNTEIVSRSKSMGMEVKEQKQENLNHYSVAYNQ